MDLQDLLLEKQQGREGLVLGGGADVAVDGQVGQELVDLGGPHRGRVADAVEEDEAPDPADVGVLGPGAVVPEADGLADAIQQARWVRWSWGRRQAGREAQAGASS